MREWRPSAGTGAPPGVRRIEGRGTPRLESHLSPRPRSWNGAAPLLTFARPTQKEYRSSFQGSAVLLYPRTSQYPGSSSFTNVIWRSHFALFHAYRFGTTRRIGPPCSRGRGFPSWRYASSTSSSSRTSRGRFVVYPASPHVRTTCFASRFGCTRSAIVRNPTPSHRLSNRDHAVTQWKSAVTW